MGLFRRRDDELTALRSSLDELRTEITERAAAEAALRDDLATVRAELAAMASADRAPRDPAIDELEARLRAIDARLSTPMPPPSTPPPVTSGPGADPAELRALGTQLARLDERLAAVDRRVTVVSTELANQLAEIDSDIDALQRFARDAAPATDATIDTTTDPGQLDELRDSQLRLANEQARYQIAFREDLARLAEQLRRRHRP